MPDYSKGVIYTIRCLNDPNVYVGSTIQSLAVRMGGHRKDYYKNKVLGKYKEIVKDIKDWKIELYEVYPCLNKQELLRREGQIIRLLGTLNKCIAGRTQREYYIDNIETIKEKSKEYKKQYYIDNVYKIKEYNKKKKLEETNTIKLKNKEYQKQYDIENADKVKERKKIYRVKNADILKEKNIKNKDKIKEYMKEYYLKKKLEKCID